jgi:hypothetical protein
MKHSFQAFAFEFNLYRYNAVHKFFELVTIKTSVRTLRVALTGEGISPSLDVEPADVLDVGDAAPGDISHSTMTVTNPTQFALKYMVVLRDVVAPGTTNRCPFVCSPSGGVIQPGAAAAVTVSFSPDRAGRVGNFHVIQSRTRVMGWHFSRHYFAVKTN